MTDRYEEMSKLAKALTEVNKVVIELDHSVLEEDDLKVLKEYNEFSKTFSEHVLTLVRELFIKTITDALLGEVEE